MMMRKILNDELLRANGATTDAFQWQQKGELLESVTGMSFLLMNHIDGYPLYVSGLLATQIAPIDRNQVDNPRFWNSFLRIKDRYKLILLYKKMKSLSVEELMEKNNNFWLKCHVFIKTNYGKMPFCLQMKPLQWNNGEMSVSCCTFFPAPSSLSNLLLLFTESNDYYWIYDLQEGKWGMCPYPQLSVAERKILYYASCGYLQEDIAQMICCSVNTVKTHKRAIFKKLHVNSTLEAVALIINRCIIKI